MMFLSHIVFIYLFIYLVIQVVYDAHTVLAMSLAIIQKFVGTPQKFIIGHLCISLDYTESHCYIKLCSIIFSVVYPINMSRYTFKVYHTYPKNTIYTTLSLVFSSILLQVHFISAIVFPPLIVTVGC